MKAKHEHWARYGVLGALYGLHHHQGGGADQDEKKKVRSRSLLSFTAWHVCAAKISLGFIAVTSDTGKTLWRSDQKDLVAPYCWHLREQSLSWSKTPIPNLKLTKCLNWKILQNFVNQGRHQFSWPIVKKITQIRNQIHTSVSLIAIDILLASIIFSMVLRVPRWCEVLPPGK